MKKQKQNSVLRNQIEKQFPIVKDSCLKSEIKKCINYKISSYYRFLITKLEFQQIKHRKIVQQISYRYIPQCQIKLCCGYGENLENIKNFAKILRLLPLTQHFSLQLFGNKLGWCKEKFLHLGQGLLQLNNLKYLKLDLFSSNLWQNKENLKVLGNYLKQLVNLQTLHLDLQSNFLGQDYENLKPLRHILPKNLQILQLELSKNQIGLNNNIEHLVGLIKKLISIQILKLGLSHNNFHRNQKANILQQLGESFRKLLNLQSLTLDLRGNQIEIQEIQEFREEYLDILPNLKIEIFQ